MYFPRSSFLGAKLDITRALCGEVFGIRVSHSYMVVGGQLDMGSRSA